ncbi:MarR family transcriptional regulator [Curtobacterium sp. SORGH_AS_0776]|jgi:DNA-binding MarR family transcriptional regulator|uniref:MarR family winged helix-turn-helix transcriptional regulator n=1 Tax=Curtobacterium sp. SORGH_AS_0776 TaxID=3041798 RepID=UPI0028596679|nr:MarR family transcriptional regulator [Curtobacterium sp. SORGH_AS_0776]MDR6170376.1 DNA-binding MarR family transcriptional regulator [Curtobacterium sp. SORGH_AS_0776]
MPQEDEVDRIVAAWGRERADLDFGPLEVLSRVDRLARHLDRARRAAFDASDVEPWEFDVLSALRRAGEPYELSPKTLLQQTLVSSGTMTNRVDRLAARGLVARRTDPKDGRGILVSLTGAGRAAVDAAIADLLAAERAILAGVSDTEQDQLSGLLRRLILGLGD